MTYSSELLFSKHVHVSKLFMSPRGSIQGSMLAQPAERCRRQRVFESTWTDAGPIAGARLFSMLDESHNLDPSLSPSAFMFSNALANAKTFTLRMTFPATAAFTRSHRGWARALGAPKPALPVRLGARGPETQTHPTPGCPARVAVRRHGNMPIPRPSGAARLCVPLRSNPWSGGAGGATKR